MLQATDLTCVRGDRCLFRQLGLSVAPGQLLLVEGENGAGKTSLLRILAGLGLPALGQVLWRGQPIARQRETYGQALLYLGHLGALKEELSAAENLLADARIAGLPGIGVGQVADALGLMGLKRVAGLQVRVLSAGQRRRAALARLLLEPPPLWILDEPFNALDTTAVELLRRTLEAHLAQGGMAVLTSHQPVALNNADTRCLRLSA